MITLMSNSDSKIINIYSPDFEFKGILQAYISLIWTEEYNGLGTFTLICVDSPENIALLQMGYYIYQNNKKTAMIIKYVKPNSEDSIIEVSGYTTLFLLSQRTIFPTQTITQIESGIYALVERFFKGSESIRNIPNFTTHRLLYGLKGYTYSQEKQITGNYVDETVFELGEFSEFGAVMNFDFRNNRHVFEVYQGLDRTFGNGINDPALFTVEFGNLPKTIIIDDMSVFKNVAYVAGAGEGTARKYVIVGDTTGIDRYELWVDARDLQQEYTDDSGNNVTLTNAQYTEVLKSRGLSKLNEHLRAKSFNGEVDPANFRTEFYLGDIVSCRSERYGYRIDARISKYTEVTEKNKTKLVLTLGTPEILSI